MVHTVASKAGNTKLALPQRKLVGEPPKQLSESPCFRPSAKSENERTETRRDATCSDALGGMMVRSVLLGHSNSQLDLRFSSQATSNEVCIMM